MKKRQYKKPQTEVVELHFVNQLLAGSPVGTNVYEDEDAEMDEYGL